MTYCLAWIENNKLYMITDSAVSVFDDSDLQSREYTTFGEIQEKHRDFFVFEGQNKISIIKDKYVVCYAANDIKHADEVIQLIDSCLDDFDIIQTLEMVKNSVSYTDVQLLIGYSDSSTVKLLLFDLNTVKYGDKFQIGGASKIEEWNSLVNRWLKFTICEEHRLAIIISMLQMQSIKNRLITKGAGGTYSGLMIAHGEIAWVPGITYSILDSNKKSDGFVSVIHRDNMVLTSSTYNSEVKVLANSSINKGEPPTEKIMQYINVLDELEMDYLVLSNMNQKKVLVMFIDKWLHNEHFNLWKRDRGLEFDYILSFQGLIYDFLFTSKYGDDDELTLHCLELENTKTEPISLSDYEKKHKQSSNMENIDQYY